MKKILKCILIILLGICLALSFNLVKYPQRELEFRSTRGYIALDKSKLEKNNSLSLNLSFYLKGNHLIKHNYIKKVLNGEVTLNNGIIKIDSSEIKKQGRDFKGYGLYNMVLNVNEEDILKLEDNILLDTINLGKEKYEIGKIYIEKCNVVEPILETKRISALKIGEGVGSYNITLENISVNNIEIENIYTGEFESMGPSVNIGIYENYSLDEESFVKDRNSISHKGYEVKSKEILKMTIDFRNKNALETNFILAPKVELLEKGEKKTICLDMYSAGNVIDRATFIKEIEEKD